MDALARATGRERKPVDTQVPDAPVKTPKRRATDTRQYRHVKTEHIQIDIPVDAPPDELIELANKLIRIAEKASERKAV